MTNQFNFLGLPSVVQDLITKEIVHNSIPEDRIQLALTSKYCNELVQCARPKKVIDKFWIWIVSCFTFIANSREYTKTEEQLMEILPNCQIKQLILCDESVFSSEDYSEILDMLPEAARFATKLDIILPLNLDVEDEVVGFYVKLKHLKSVTVRNPKLILPYYPSKVTLKSCYYNQGNILEDLAVKSQNCPLLFFELELYVSLEKCQQFLQTANFSVGAEIRILNDFPLHLIYFGQNTFTLELFPKNSELIFVSQKFVGKNRRIKLKTSCCHISDMAFNVISASNPEKNYFSGVFKGFQPQMIINLENVDRDEILIFESVDKIIKYGNYVAEYYARPMYSAKMLESAFPTANFTTPLERVETINNVLGTNIQLIQVENFVQTVEVFRKTH